MDATAAPSRSAGIDTSALHQLVEALVEQLAAGQVETLYSLHTAAANVRHEAQKLESAAAAPAAAFDEAAEGIQSSTASLLRAQDTLETGRSALQSVVDTLAAELADAVTNQVVTTANERIGAVVEAHVTSGLQRIDNAIARLDAAAANWQAAANAAGVEWEERADRVATAAADKLEQRARDITATADDTVAAIQMASGVLVDAFATRIEDFFAELRDELAARQQRDRALDEELRGRVDALAERTEATISGLTARLSAESDRLARRDAELEHARAEAFVDVLETLLTRVGGRRQLRARVREAVSAERPPPPVQPELDIPEPPPPPIDETSPPPPKKAPTKRTPAVSKASAKKAVAKKASPAETSTTRKKAP